MQSLDTTSIVDAETDPAINAQQTSTYSKLYNVAGSVLNGTLDTANVVLPLTAHTAGRAVNIVYNTIREGINGAKGAPFHQAA